MSTLLRSFLCCLIVSQTSTASWIRSTPSSNENGRCGRLEKTQGELALVRQRLENAMAAKEKEINLRDMDLKLMSERLSEILERKNELEHGLKIEEQAHDEDVKSGNKRNQNLQFVHQTELKQLESDNRNLQLKVQDKDEMVQKQQFEHQEELKRLMTEMEKQAEDTQLKLQEKDEMIQKQQLRTYHTMVREMENQAEQLKSAHERELMDLRNDVKRTQSEHEEQLKRLVLDYQEQLEEMGNQGLMQQSEYQIDLRKAKADRDAQFQKRNLDHEQEVEAMRRTHEMEMDAALRLQEERLQKVHEEELQQVQLNRILIGRQLFTLQGQVEELQETNRRLAAESVSLKDELQGMKSAHEAGTGALNDGHEAVVTSMQSLLDVVTQRLAVRDGELADRDDELAVLNRALTEEIANSERRKSEVEELEKEKSEWDNKVKEEHERFLICIVVIVVLVVAILSGFGAFVARWCCKLGKNIAEKGIDGKLPKMKLSMASKLKADIP